jgi:hypothetical protein
MLFKLILNLLVVLVSSSVFALTQGVEKLIEFETSANAAALRSTKMIMMPHVEIPIEHVGVDFAKRIDPRIASSLIIENEGQKRVRWILNPEDTKWGLELIKHLKAKGIMAEIQYYFKGYQTASRSYIAEDPIYGVQFSVKSSTNITGGNWNDKKQPVGEATDGRLLSDFLHDQNKRRPFENLVVMDEPAILKIDAIDQAIVIRDLGAIKNADAKRYFLPGFSALHESVGKQIALKNGSQDAHAFWTENYIKVVGKALGELAARTGIQFDSPHSQNFLIELDSQFKPTGKLILRDMSDLYVDINYLKALLGDNNKILLQFTQASNKLDHIAAGFGPLHGNKFPGWISNQQYSDWIRVFFKEFESTFEKISGYDLAKLNVSKYQRGNYFVASYKLAGLADFSEHFNGMRKHGVVARPIGQMSCKSLLASNE